MPYAKTLIAIVAAFSALCLASCASRGGTDTGYVASTDILPSGVLLHLKHHYPGYHGFGMCGNWASYPAGYSDYTLLAPSATGHFDAIQVEYRDANGILEYGVGSVELDANRVVVTLINRSDGTIYRRDIYDARKVTPN